MEYQKFQEEMDDILSSGYDFRITGNQREALEKLFENAGDQSFDYATRYYNEEFEADNLREGELEVVAELLGATAETRIVFTRGGMEYQAFENEMHEIRCSGDDFGITGNQREALEKLFAKAGDKALEYANAYYNRENFDPASLLEYEYSTVAELLNAAWYDRIEDCEVVFRAYQG